MTQSSASRAPLIIGLLLGFALLIVAAVYMGLRVQTSSGGQASIGGPFTMTSATTGERVTEKSLLGKTSLMFFGFTHCPDVCPTALYEITQILNELTPAEIRRLNVVFTSVDPERDTPEQMKLYLSSFHPAILGFSGSEADMAKMAKLYRVYYRKIPLDAGGYTMDHTALVYLMDMNGQFIRPFDIKAAPKEAAAKLRSYL